MTPKQPPDAASIASLMRTAREVVGKEIAAGLAGRDIARNLTVAAEGAVLDLLSFHLAQPEPEASPGIAVLATGSFGRRELAPYSDLDLLFLCKDTPDARIEALAHAILVPLWDAKLDAGHAVRSVADGLALPDTDLAAATALLDARYLVGDRQLASQFMARYEARVAGSAPDSFVGRLREEQESRHTRYGDTIYMLEPDLKSGPGGIRDLCLGRWASQACFGASTPTRLAEMGQMSSRQAEALSQAIDFMLRLRATLQLTAGRRQDHLRFDLQEMIAPKLYPDHAAIEDESSPAVTPAVEALMRDFQTHATTIRRSTERLMQRICARAEKRSKVKPLIWKPSEGFQTFPRFGSAGPSPAPPSRLVWKPAPPSRPEIRGRSEDPSFVLRNGMLEVKDVAVFDRQPSEMLRLFTLSLQHDVGIGLDTMDLLSELAVNRGAELRADPSSAQYFLEVLTNVEDRAVPSRLEQMQDTGLISAVIPDWTPVRGRVQHDIYHVYTVDQHSLYAVANLKAIARGELRDEYPEVCDAYPEVSQKRALFFAVLLHDIGKPLGADHAQKGAVMAERIARQLGLSEEEVALVEFLVREHLEMGHNSQRRDLEDPSLLDFFARLCGTEERMRQLFVLTFCDLNSTGPATMTRWKYELLHELYHRTLMYMRRGPDLLAAERAELVQERQEKAAELLGEPPGSDAARHAFAGLPDRYFAEQEAERIAEHILLMRGRKLPCAMTVSHSERGTFSELVLVADDTAGLLAKVAGVLFANRIDILDAAIYVREAVPGIHERGEALDIFRIRKEPDGAVTEEHRIAAIRRDMEAVLSGQAPVESLVAKRPRASSLYQRAKPKVPPTEINLDNDASRTFTIVEVFTEDKPGVLYTITRTLAQQGVDIHRSRVGVAADRVADIFYVRDSATESKVEDEDRIAALSQALQQALASLR